MHLCQLCGEVKESSAYNATQHSCRHSLAPSAMQPVTVEVAEVPPMLRPPPPARGSQLPLPQAVSQPSNRGHKRGREEDKEALLLSWLWEVVDTTPPAPSPSIVAAAAGAAPDQQAVPRGGDASPAPTAQQQQQQKGQLRWQSPLQLATAEQQQAQQPTTPHSPLLLTPVQPPQACAANPNSRQRPQHSTPKPSGLPTASGQPGSYSPPGAPPAAPLPLSPRSTSKGQLPPVPADLPDLPGQLHPAPGPKPEPTLVRRALEKLEEFLPEPRDLPSTDELLNFNQLLGLGLWAGPAANTPAGTTTISQSACDQQQQQQPLSPQQKYQQQPPSPLQRQPPSPPLHQQRQPPSPLQQQQQEVAIVQRLARAGSLAATASSTGGGQATGGAPLCRVPSVPFTPSLNSLRGAEWNAASSTAAHAARAASLAGALDTEWIAAVPPPLAAAAAAAAGAPPSLPLLQGFGLARHNSLPYLAGGTGGGGYAPAAALAAAAAAAAVAGPASPCCTSPASATPSYVVPCVDGLGRTGKLLVYLPGAT